MLSLHTLHDAVCARLGLDAPPSASIVIAVTSVVAASGLVLWAARGASKPSREAGRAPHLLQTTKPVLGNTLDLMAHMADLHDWMTQWCLHYKGEPYALRSFGRPDITVVYTPQLMEDVFKTQFENFPKGPFMCGNLRDVLGHGIFAVDEKPWYNQRKVASHMFTMRAVRESMAVSVTKHLMPLCRVFRKAASLGEPLDVFRLFNRFTMETFAEIGFGIDMQSLESPTEHPLQRALDRVQEIIVLRFLRPSWFWKLQRWLNIGAEFEMKQAIATLDATVLEIVTKAFERRTNHADASSNGEFHDVVSLFLDHLDAIDAEQHRDIEFNASFFRDVVMNFLFAGRDTTAQTLSWFFVELENAPDIERKILAELQRLLPSDDAPLSVDDIQHLVYLEAAVRETLRLHPPVPINTKHVTKDTVLSDGTFLREGTTVSLASWAMGRMPFVWGEDAAEFKLERWIDASTGKLASVSHFKFVSFNAGPRVCLGINLAMMEIKMVLATLLRRFHIQLVPEQNITYVNSVTLPIKGEMLVTVSEVPL